MVHKLKTDAKEAYMIETLMWAIWVPHSSKELKAPKLPEILKS